MEEFELEPGEEIIRSVRVHPFVLASRLAPFVLLFFVPAFLSLFVSLFASSSPQAAGVLGGISLGHIGRFLTGVWLLGVWMGAFTVFTQYYLTVWIVTSLRIVDIHQLGFFNRTVSSFMLARIQDVTTDTSGLLATLFHYGRLSVDTAGKEADFTMEGIAYPEEMRDIIMRQVAAVHQADPAGL